MTGEVVTAAQMNAHVRDNLLETAPAAATAADELIVTTAANAITEGHNNLHVMTEAIAYG